MWWETAAEKGPVLLHRTGSHEPTSTASPQTEPCRGKTKTLKIQLFSLFFLSLSLYVFGLTSPLPFQDQVEPVSEHSHPDEPEPRVPPQVEPDWEEAEERGVQIGHCGRQAKQALISAVFGLQMDRQLDPPAVEKIHAITTSAWGWCTESGGVLVFFCQLVCSFMQSPLFCHSVIPIGLYSRLANLFTFGTVQTWTLTPPRPPWLKSIITEISCHPLNRSQISRKTFFSLINELLVKSIDLGSQFSLCVQWTSNASFVSSYLGFGPQKSQNANVAFKTMSSSWAPLPELSPVTTEQQLGHDLQPAYLPSLFLSQTISSASSQSKPNHLIIDLVM